MSTAQQENKMNRTQPIKSINVDDITFQVGKAQAGRNPSVSMKLKGQPFNIGLRNMRAPGGMNRRENEGAPDAFTLMVGLPGCPRDGTGMATAEAAADGSGPGELTDAQAFYNFLRALEPKMLAAATENSAKWFGRPRTQAAVEDGLKRVINVSSTKVDGVYVPNGKYDPSFRVKVPIYEGQVKCAVEDGAKNPVYLGSPDDLMSAFPKGAGLNLVVSGNIYILAGGGFGVTWRLGAAQVFPPSRPRLTDFFEAVDAPSGGGGGGGGGGPLSDAEDDGQLSQGGRSAVSSGATPGVMYGGGGGGQERPSTPEDQTPAPVQPTAPARKRRSAA
jgi:hypothetical protein